VDEKIIPLLNGILKLNLAEEEHHRGEGDHVEKG
jgi:hypothetical protein